MSTYEQLTDELMTLNQRFHRVYHHHHMSHRSRTDIMILRLLYKSAMEGQQYTMSQLAQCMDVSNPAISRKIGELESQSLVERYAAEHNRRNTYVRLTAEGQAMIAEEFERMRHFTQEALEHISIEDIMVFLSIGNRFADAMQQTLQTQQKGDLHDKTN